jgi:hypothetical protein
MQKIMMDLSEVTFLGSGVQIPIDRANLQILPFLTIHFRLQVIHQEIQLFLGINQWLAVVGKWQ